MYFFELSNFDRHTDKQKTNEKQLNNIQTYAMADPDDRL